jgi:hypothetical protein
LAARQVASEYLQMIDERMKQMAPLKQSPLQVMKPTEKED